LRFTRDRILMIPEERCPMCRRVRMLSREQRCTIHLKAAYLAAHHRELDSDRISGSSPPGVFVGRFGYPKIFVGPMVPARSGDTQILDTPEWWMGKGFDDIVDFRYSLVRGYTMAHVVDARRGGRLIESLQEAAMMASPVEAELVLARRPRKVLDLREDSQPFGPMAPLTSFRIGSASVDRRIEKAYYDTDLGAADAIYQLFRQKVLVTRIQRAFSMGMLGIGGRRKLVPTRWSITAVDSTLGSILVERVKQNPTIDEYRVYNYTYLDNIYVGILSPERWRFEWIEAWFEPELLALGFPDTDFATDVEFSSYVSPEGYRPAMLGDWEGYQGRKTYAKPGGCYYAARFAVAEYLDSINRQAGALLLREIHPGYIMPVGVWNVRESIRAMLKAGYERFDSLDAALDHACTILEIPKPNWIEASALLKQAYFQRRITDFS